jgi:PiT family inorganic phosphate transporter
MNEPIILIGLFLIAALAFANGSNDVSKGIATLAGSGVTDYRKAILWGTVWTVIGGMLAVYLSKAMVKTFANGILSNPSGAIHDPPQAEPLLPIAVMIGAMAWVLFASRTGLPVSTTHAITGAIAGAGLAALGLGGIQWNSLAHKVLWPLAMSPLLAMGIAFLIFPAIRRALSNWKGHCVCLLPVQKGHLAVEQNGLIRMIPAQTEVIPIVDSPQCDTPQVLSVRIGPDTFHWITSGLTSFARGLNDAPKMAALLVGLSLVPGGGSSSLMTFGFAVVAVGMGLGSWIGGLRVTEVLAEKVTRMDHLEGFSANLTTSLLVTSAAHLGLPVSTTHVSSSAIIGMGLRKGSGLVNWKTVSEMVLAWVLTLPVTGLLSAGIYLLLTGF